MSSMYMSLVTNLHTPRIPNKVHVLMFVAIAIDVYGQDMPSAFGIADPLLDLNFSVAR